MNRCLALCGYNMGNTASRRPLLLRFKRPRTAMAATLAACLTWVLLFPDTVHALDPNKRLTQYLHTSWRIQDGSAPSGMFTVAQTSDGFLWFSTYSPTIYRFDGVRFLPRHFPYKGGSSNKVIKVFGDHAGGLWAVGSREIAYIKDGAVTSDFQLDGFSSFQNVSEDPDGSLWIVRAGCEYLGLGSLSRHRDTRSSASERQMAYRSARSIPYWPTAKAVSGSEGRPRSCIGMTVRRRCIRSKR